MIRESNRDMKWIREAAMRNGLKTHLSRRKNIYTQNNLNLFTLCFIKYVLDVAKFLSLPFPFCETIATFSKTYSNGALFVWTVSPPIPKLFVDRRLILTAIFKKNQNTA